MPSSLPISVSVVIPTLREAANIGALLRALQTQDYPAPLQIIVADGASDDDTAQIARTFPDVLLIDAPRGVSRQRNAGAKHATGDLLIFMDADDLPPPRFVQSVTRSFARWPFAVACPWLVARERDFGARAAYFGFNLLFWAGQNTLRMGSGVCIITRRDVFQRVGGFDETLHLGEDIHYIRRAARLGWHRHLLIPIGTSGRRYRSIGFWKLSWFYARITPPLLLGQWHRLRQMTYEAAPYSIEKTRDEER